MSVDCASMTLDTTGEAPVETPLKRRLKRRLKPWLKRGLEALGEAPVEARVEEPVEARAEARVEALGEAPVEARAKARVEARVEEPADTPVNVPQSLGVVGYAAFALLRPVPLGEIAPFPLVVTAFEAEASQQVLAPAPEPAPEPEPEPEDMVPDFTAPPPVPAVSYAVGGYRPAPGPQTWGRELPEPASAPDPARHEVEVPVDVSVPPEMAAPTELDPVGLGVTAVPEGGPFRVGGYAADRASADRQARQVLDELSFLFDGN